MEGVRKFLRGEPVVVQNLVVALAAVAAAFGFAFTGVQVAAVVAAVAAVSAFFARGKVSPAPVPEDE